MVDSLALTLLAQCSDNQYLDIGVNRCVLLRNCLVKLHVISVVFDAAIMGKSCFFQDGPPPPRATPMGATR